MSGRIIFNGLLAVLFVAFAALGTWQVQRLFWKLDLIARVDARVHAPAVAPPGVAQWRHVTATDDEYRHVTVSGRFFNDKQALVQALTERGAGYWVMTPLQLQDGSVILINRGFVPAERRAPVARAQGEIEGPVHITGLVRMSEPNGGFLRSNDPAGDRWYSRDVAAIARSRGLATVAPYFIDADATPNPGGLPVGGLTVVHFANSHAVYIATWYILAAMVVVAAVMINRRRKS